MLRRLSLGSGLEASGGFEAAFEIGDNLVDMFYADGETYLARGSACLQLVFRRQLRMGRRRWMNGKAARVV